MAGVNKVILLGNLGRDPEVRSLENGTKVASFSIATTESYKDKTTGERKELTEWHNIVLWRGLAEVAEKYLTKGSKIYLEGKLQTRSYQDKEGVTKYTTEIVGRELNMIGGRPEGGESYSPAQSPSSNVAESAVSEDPTDDLPF